MDSDRTQAVSRLYEEAVVIDALGGDLVPSSLAQLKAGITAFNATIASPHASFMDVVQGVYLYLTYLEALDDKLLLVRTAADILEAKGQRRLGLIFGLQDANCLEGKLPLLKVLHHLGLRVTTLTYNERNDLGSGCHEDVDYGLTSFGKQVVREAERLGIVIDMSHTGEKTTMQAMEIMENPPIFSHSNPRSMTPSARCVTDSQIKRAAELGGVIGISVWSPMTYSKPGERPTISDYMDRMEYVIDLVGINHVGIGSDIFGGKNPILWRATTKRRYPDIVGAFDRDTIHVAGLDTHPDLVKIALALAKRGYTDEDIQKVLGGNLLRVFSKVLG